ncbi:MAG: hydrogenase small subunit [Akkermansia sp.]
MDTDNHQPDHDINLIGGDMTTWRKDETLGTHMERRGVSRREFNSWCLKIIGLMGIATITGGTSNAQELADKMAAIKRPVVVWLQLQECTGCLESTIRSYNEEIGNLVLSVVSMPYVELLMAPSGDFANKALEEAEAQPHILVVNGSVPTKDGGIYCTIGGETCETVLRRAAKNATHVLAVGSCAYFGSIQASRPNPTGAVGIRDILTDIPVINVPGCPPIGDVITAVLLYIIMFDRDPACDSEGRPLMAYGQRIHNNCPRRAHFDAGQFVDIFDDEKARNCYCLYKVGCKGPNTFSPCPIVKWNGGVSFPIQAGHPCIGCTELYFFDRMTPFYKTLPDVKGFGIESTANALGVAAMAGTGVAIAAHIAGTAVQYKRQHMKEEANVSLPAYGDVPGTEDRDEAPQDEN